MFCNAGLVVTSLFSLCLLKYLLISLSILEDNFARYIQIFLMHYKDMWGVLSFTSHVDKHLKRITPGLEMTQSVKTLAEQP